MRTADMSTLHPEFARPVEAMLDELHARKIPLQVFETARAPSRQEELFARGRDPSAADFGRTVTKARAYQSAHQYGLAVDLAFLLDGKWSWDPPPGHGPMWNTYHDIARDHGLKPLSFEKPHVEIKAFDWRVMSRGPDDDAGWAAWLRKRNTGGVA